MKQVTIRLDEDTIEYFKGLAEDKGAPNLINLIFPTMESIMQCAEQLRIEFAKNLIRNLANVTAHAILIGGSVAKGWADDYSDIELCFCWEQVPDSDARRLIIEQLSGTDILLSSAATCEPIEDNFLVDGLQIDMWHCSNDVIERYITEAATSPLALAKQETLWAVQNGIVLKSSNFLEKWRSSIQFPRNIRAKIIESHLEVITSCDLQLHAGRGDIAVLFGLISGIQKRMAYILFALNGTFSMGIKHMAESLRVLAIKPLNIWQRFQKSYAGTLISCANETDLLIHDVVALVKEHLPEVSLSELKRFEAFRRDAWPKSDHVGGRDG